MILLNTLIYGYSGLILDRPALIRLTADIEAYKIDTVVVRSVDRIARDYLKANVWIKKINAHKVTLIALDGSHEIPNLRDELLGMIG